MRVPKEPSDPAGKGAFWAIDPNHLDDFENGVFIGRIRGSDYRALQKKKYTHTRPILYTVNGVIVHRQDSQVPLMDEPAPSGSYSVADPTMLANSYDFNGPAPVAKQSFGYAAPPTSSTPASAYPAYGYAPDVNSGHSALPVDNSVKSEGYPLAATIAAPPSNPLPGSYHYEHATSQYPKTTHPWQSVAFGSIDGDASSVAPHLLPLDRGAAHGMYSPFSYGIAPIHGTSSAYGPSETATIHSVYGNGVNGVGMPSGPAMEMTAASGSHQQPNSLCYTSNASGNERDASELSNYRMHAQQYQQEQYYQQPQQQQHEFYHLPQHYHQQQQHHQLQNQYYQQPQHHHQHQQLQQHPAFPSLMDAVQRVAGHHPKK